MLAGAAPLVGAVRPAATMMSVGLADPRMRIEIEVTRGSARAAPARAPGDAVRARTGGRTRGRGAIWSARLDLRYCRPPGPRPLEAAAVTDTAATPPSPRTW